MTALKTRLRDRSLIGILALCALAGLAVFSSPPSRAQTGAPKTLGTIDQSFVWSPQVNVVPVIDACHAKAQNAQPTWTGSSYQLPEPTCLLRAMRAGGASSNAMAFTRWYAAQPDGDEAFIMSLRKPRFGIVSVAEIERPGQAVNNWCYIFVNGKPAVINPEEGFTTRLPWTKNAPFLAIKRAHPNAGVFPDEDFVGESARPNGGQRFTIAAPIVDGCHACARIGIVYVGFDFGALGAAKGWVITAVHRCPSSDALCGAGFARLPSSGQGTSGEARRGGLR